ncbi:hypothetical protein DNTS_034852, partial [Danionella cerebrum]
RSHNKENGKVSRLGVREILVRINPAAAARRWSSTVSRRVCNVPYPNSLWHIDGNMRLIRWGFMIHGAIDGYSRLITYLNGNTDNCASTVLSQFVQAMCLYGLSARNLQVALFMSLMQGILHNSHITGESVHNQRIKRLWRDVFFHVLQSFYSLEDSELLDPGNDVHKVSLSLVFLQEIHVLQTKNNKTPTQILTEGMLSREATDSTAINNVFGDDPYRLEYFNEHLSEHGIESLPTAEDEDIPAVTNEWPRITLSPQQIEMVSNAIEHVPDLKFRSRRYTSQKHK